MHDFMVQNYIMVLVDKARSIKSQTINVNSLDIINNTSSYINICIVNGLNEFLYLKISIFGKTVILSGSEGQQLSKECKYGPYFLSLP
ncbi:hypothetical protein KUTeg_023264 [Tegillarca granosa]|uniref:Uncharacterized protein n=1 Tax=Tegillarca granosa TaxID=220873 RepID=A0ABQ9E4P1_TEGGR|nr:hypothetical protein KUTeg_023264 [Tegillarca granosa]